MNLPEGSTSTLLRRRAALPAVQRVLARNLPAGQGPFPVTDRYGD